MLPVKALAGEATTVLAETDSQAWIVEQTHDGPGELPMILSFEE